MAEVFTDIIWNATDLTANGVFTIRNGTTTLTNGSDLWAHLKTKYYPNGIGIDRYPDEPVPNWRCRLLRDCFNATHEDLSKTRTYFHKTEHVLVECATLALKFLEPIGYALTTENFHEINIKVLEELQQKAIDFEKHLKALNKGLENLLEAGKVHIINGDFTLTYRKGITNASSAQEIFTTGLNALERSNAQESFLVDVLDLDLNYEIEKPVDVGDQPINQSGTVVVGTESNCLQITNTLVEFLKTLPYWRNYMTLNNVFLYRTNCAMQNLFWHLPDACGHYRHTPVKQFTRVQNTLVIIAQERIPLDSFLYDCMVDVSHPLHKAFARWEIVTEVLTEDGGAFGVDKTTLPKQFLEELRYVETDNLGLKYRYLQTKKSNYGFNYIIKW